MIIIQIYVINHVYIYIHHVIMCSMQLHEQHVLYVQ